MALLAGAAAVRDERRWTIHVAHLDHGLRATSAADADFVKSEAEKRGARFHCRRVAVGELARRRHRSTEETGREARYAFLEEVASGLAADTVIATAHTADDSAETILLNLARGAGISGLRGIPERRGRIVRPLLGCRREDIARWVEEEGVPYRSDETNMDLAYARNRVRAEVMPALLKINPGAVDALLRFGSLAADDDEVLNDLARAELGRRTLPGSPVRLDWRDPPPAAIGRRMLRFALGSTLGSAPSRERIDALLEAATGPRGGVRVELGGGRVAMVRGRIIELSTLGE